MGKNFEVIVLGTGAMGAAAASAIASRGHRVLALDRFRPPHEQGSTHGETRLTRLAYFEHPDYVPLLKRARDLWLAFTPPVYVESGIVYFGQKDSPVLAGVRRSANQYHIPLEETKAERFAHFAEVGGLDVIFEPHAGYLWVNETIRSFLRTAEENQATLRFDEPALEWKASSDGVEVTTSRETYSAARLIIAGGSWSSGLLRQKIPLAIHRQTLFWFRPTKPPPPGMPCFAFARERFLYGFVPTPLGLKIADHTRGKIYERPEDVERTLTSEDSKTVVDLVRAHLPWVDPTPTEGKVCLYTMTPDSHFVIDRHEKFENVYFAAGLSGHGFKFAPVIGECLADLAIEGKTSHPIEFLRADRFNR